MSLSKRVAITFGPIILGGIVLAQGLCFNETGTLNPLKQRKFYSQKAETERQDKEAKYELIGKIDRDSNGMYSVQELLAFCNKVEIDPVEMDSRFSVYDLSIEEVRGYNESLELNNGR